MLVVAELSFFISRWASSIFLITQASFSALDPKLSPCLPYRNCCRRVHSADSCRRRFSLSSCDFSTPCMCSRSERALAICCVRPASSCCADAVEDDSMPILSCRSFTSISAAVLASISSCLRSRCDLSCAALSFRAALAPRRSSWSSRIFSDACSTSSWCCPADLLTELLWASISSSFLRASVSSLSYSAYSRPRLCLSSCWYLCSSSRSASSSLSFSSS
mmetsp:Transcript_37095/g.104694  ORF Transcript_37095/g.104694 Transcript_37095/m.104694 type:complete len:220 (-) Transcript_37095:925-1584(-)